MSLNDLPDYCLWKIFENIDEAKDLIRLSKVCSRWSDLIQDSRFNRVKYLQIMYGKVDYIDVNYLRINFNTNWNDYNLVELFPNLKIIDGVFFVNHPSHNLLKIFKNNTQMKGLLLKDIDMSNCGLSRNGYLENVEMCALEHDFDYKKVFRPDQLKQVYVYNFDMNDLPSFIRYFPNLKRFNLRLVQADGVFYNGPNLSSLKILELDSTDWVKQFTGFHFMDFCPSLESAFIHYWARDIYVDESIKNYNLRDLVFDNIISHFFSWPVFKNLLSKFPNLHHLAIRDFYQLDDSNLEELIKLLPELKILDLRGCTNSTHVSADILSKFCVKENRSIAIYYDCENEPTEWPKLVKTYDRICCGLDFMKHCFYKKYKCLPDLIDE
ncbi:uncharacterized protein LOC128388976 [Panonychus citri]|uniref:uncharacterized protein LOC128388976 n=1 Tax=Panonychus citri TaxID=50023 RepID=UPI00230740A8|nr:uncharacterized protein LOC128388976 [Panonychus citri]